MFSFNCLFSFFFVINHVYASHSKIEFKTEQSSLTECMTSTCKITSTESCSIKTLKPKSFLNLIEPGGQTSCLNSDFPFLFSVQLGESTKDVLLYFQGGGGCLDQNGFNSFACNVCSVLGTRGGIINSSNRNNVFKSYTIIEVFYCSGDFHIGNNGAPFSDSHGPAKYSGQENTMTVLKWIQSQQRKNLLPSVFDNFVIAGSSAGSGAVQFWSNEVANMFKAKSFAAMADSYFNYYPSTPNGKSREILLFGTIGFCKPSTIVSIPQELLVKCANQTLTATSVFEHTISKNPKIPFYSVLAKNDFVLTLTHNALAPFLGVAPYNPVGPEFYNDLYANALTVLNKYPNFLIFIVQGFTHTYINHDYLYTTSEKGCLASLTDIDAQANGCSLTISGSYDLSKEINALPLKNKKSSVKNVCVDVVPTDNANCGVLALPKKFSGVTKKDDDDHGGSKQVDNHVKQTSNVRLSSSQSSSRETSIGMYIGIAAGLIFAFLLAVLAFGYWWEKTNYNSKINVISVNEEQEI